VYREHRAGLPQEHNEIFQIRKMEAPTTSGNSEVKPWKEHNVKVLVSKPATTAVQTWIQKALFLFNAGKQRKAAS
jgi:hypothetical protein